MGPSTSSPSDRGSVVFPLLAIAGAVFAGAAIVVTGGNVGLALAPFLAFAGGWLLLKLPVRHIGAGFLFCVLLFENPAEGFSMGVVNSPFLAPGKILYYSLEKTLSAPGVKVFGVEVLLVFLLVIVLVRGRRHNMHTLMNRALAVAFLALIALEVWGIARGGSVRFSMLQLRPLTYFVGATWLLGLCFEGRRSIVPYLGVLVIVATLRNSVGIYYWGTLLRHGVTGPDDLGGGSYVTTHSDSVLAVSALLVLILWVFLKPSLRAIVIASMTGPIILFGTLINNRRLAIVALVIAIAMIYFVLQRAPRRRIHLLAIAATPLLVVYMAVGWNAGGGWAKPVQMVKSVFESEDASAKTRDIENYNLVVTTRPNPLLGTGFGHEYNEQVVAFDISHAFEAYRYVPHNSLLWLMSAGGIFGMSAFFGWLFLFLFLSVRLIRRTDDPDLFDVHLFALCSVGAFVVYVVQAFGDMGLYSWMGVAVFGAHIGGVGRLAKEFAIFSPPAEPVEDDVTKVKIEDA